MRGIALSVVALLALGSSAAPVAAGTLSIQYRIEGGSFVKPPGGAVTGGMYRVEFDAAGVATIISGPAILKSFSLAGSDTYVIYGDVLETSFNVQLTAQAAGQGTVGGGFRNAASAFAAGPAGIHCAGGTCGVGGFIPSVTKFYTLVLTMPMSGIAIDGDSGSLRGTYRIAGQTAYRFSLSFTGQELSRTFMPEPRGDWVLLAALAPVLALRAWLRRARPVRGCAFSK